MDLDKIEELIEVLRSSTAQELCVRKGDVSVHIRRGAQPQSLPATAEQPAESAAPVAEPVKELPDEEVVRAPMVGIFHTVDGLAEVGARISAGQVVGAIESMKLLNDVVANVSGVVVETMVDDEMPVEYGQPLCRIKVDQKVEGTG